ncbi:hypothetical protein CR513_02998, partial [Mucuna pruriens]
IHEHLHAVLYQVREDAHHAVLERARCVAQAKWHACICKGAKWAGEGHFVLIFRCNMNLHVARESIQKTVMGFPCYFLKHLVNKRQRKVILAGCLIESSVIDAHPPAILNRHRYQLVLLLFWISLAPLVQGSPIDYLRWDR